MDLCLLEDFFWLHQVLVAAGRTFVASCISFVVVHGSLVVAHSLQSMWVSVVVAPGLPNCGTQAPELVGSVAAACGLSICGTGAPECVGFSGCSMRLSTCGTQA